MLEVISPYVTYGYPSVSTIRHLLYKRGYVRVNKQRIPLSSNEIVSDSLKQYNLLCIEDLVHELYSWRSFQGGEFVSLAIQIESSKWWFSKCEDSFQ